METDEVLESGYGPGTPPGDNALNDFIQGEGDGFNALATARGDAVEEDREFGLLLADAGSATPFGNVVVLRRPLRDDEWPAVTARLQRFFGQRPGGPFLVFSGWPTPDLRTMGYGRVGHPPLMRRPVGPLEAAEVAGLAIRRVEDDETAADWERVMVEAYPVPELQPFASGCFLSGDARRAPGWRLWVGYLDGVAVATSGAFVTDHHQHVEFISAREECRGRGVGHALTVVAAVADAKKPAMLIASDLGYGTYARMGFVPFARLTLWAGHRPDQSQSG